MDQKDALKATSVVLLKTWSQIVLGRSKQTWAETRQWLGMKKYCLFFNGWVISLQNLMPICLETECIPIHTTDYTHIYTCMSISMNAIENISSKIFKHSRFEILLHWLPLKNFSEHVSLTLATGHTSDKNKAFIILQWQVFSEQKSVFVISQCKNPALHVFGVFQCGVWLLILFRIAFFHFSVLNEEWDPTWISVGQLPQIPFLVVLTLCTGEEQKKQGNVLNNQCHPSLGQIFSWQSIEKTFPNSDLSALK